jgi:hypothetical protein
MGDGSRIGNRALVLGMLVLAAVLVGLPAFVPADAHVVRSVLFGVEALLPLGSIGAVVAVMVVLRRDGPARFVVRAGAFMVPGNRVFPLWLATQLLFFSAFGGHTVDGWAHRALFGFTGVPGDLFPIVNSVLAALLFLLLIPLVVVGLRDRPALLLTRDALVVLDPLGSRTYPWEALTPWSAVRVGRLQTMVLPVVRPDLVVKRGPGWWGSKVTFGWADVHPWFFADAARLYVSMPGRRAGIGTQDEYDRLLLDLGVRVGV